MYLQTYKCHIKKYDKMNKKNIYIILVLLLLFIPTTHAQKVGINNNNPETTLDVNGKVRVRKDIRLGATAGTAGSPGSSGQVITSRGPGQSPVWTIPGGSVNLGYGIKESVVLSDSKGVIYKGTNGDYTADRITELEPEYLEDSELSAVNGWTEIEGLRSEITPTKTNNRIVVTLQTIAQAASTGYTADAVFAMGVFVDGKLKSVRPVSVLGNGAIFSIGTLFDTFENIPPKENSTPYTIQIAVALRYRNVFNASTGAVASAGEDWTVFIGTSTNVTNTNSWMNTSSLKIELYEEI